MRVGRDSSPAWAACARRASAFCVRSTCTGRGCGGWRWIWEWRRCVSSVGPEAVAYLAPDGRRARVRAAQKHSTISALVREFLFHLVQEEPEFERLRREQNEIIARIRKTHPGFSATKRVTRDEVHGRRAVC